LFKIPVAVPSQLRIIKLQMMGKKPIASEIKNHPNIDFKPSIKSISKRSAISLKGEFTKQRIVKKKIFCIKKPFKNMLFCFDDIEFKMLNLRWSVRISHN
jgi:hypothetical protein